MRPAQPADVAALAARVARSAPRLGTVRLVCVDGPAGSGKSTLAGALAARLGGACVVVHLDAPEEAFGDDLTALAPVARVLSADAGSWVLAGGEDHGLLATFPPGTVLPAPFRGIGVVAAAGDVPAGTVTVGGQVPTGPVGWDHFRG